MYINIIDNLFDGMINNFNIFLLEKNIFKKYTDDQNFVKYMNDIIDVINSFIDKINKKDIDELVGSSKNVQYIIDVIKRYCAFYIYLGIAYYYTGNGDLFITNIIETSKNIKDSSFNISNFYNSENNAKLIKMFGIIKDIQKLCEYKTIDRVKIIINNEPLKFLNTINLLNSIGEDYFVEYFMIQDNFHNIIKTLIFKQIYILEEKNEIIKILNAVESDDAEYKYIEIIEAKDNKIIDYNALRELFKTDSNLFKLHSIDDYYDFLLEYKKEKELNIIGNTKMIDFLFSNNIFIPITEDFVRYHKNTERYDKDITGELKERDATKIKYIINKINKIVNLHSTIYEKNQKLKLDAMNLFYKTYEYRDAVLYNDIEEVKIINKLNLSDNTSDLDYLVDLENMRKYAYLNYKDLSKDGIRFRTTLPIQGIRYTNIKYKKPHNRKIELRVGHSDLPLHIVGLLYNPTKQNLATLDINKLYDIHHINKNGYEGIKSIIENPDDKLYYWLFDTKHDKVKLEEYKNVSSLDNTKIIENMLAELFVYYFDVTRNNIYNKIIDTAPNNMYEAINLINKMQMEYKFTTNVPLHFKYDLLGKYFNKLKDIKIESQKDENKKTIKIPLSNFKKTKEHIHILGEKQVELDLEKIINEPVCHHYIKWQQLSKIPRKNEEELNQSIFDFVKQYVKTNERDEYVCKSCNELLDLRKYVYEGTYVPELDTFLTTNLAVNQKLYDLPKYTKFNRSIRNIEKNIEKICYITNIQYYIGNTAIIKLRRKMIIKDVIDIVLIHTDYLRKQTDNRIKIATETYGIHKNLTNLFYFEFKDDIFLTSSVDTDQFKIIKYNNIIAYILLMIIADLNTGQIISFKDDKHCNFYIYKQVGKQIFDKLYLRINEKEKILLSNIPLLCYVMYYFACVLTNNYVWLWKNNEKSQMYVTQRTIIHTMVDLINSIVEANLSKDKNIYYELIVNRIMHKIKNTYTDVNVFKLLEKNIHDKIRIEDNKISFVVKKDKVFDLNVSRVFEPIIYERKQCLSKKDKIKIKQHEMFNYNIDSFTNCPDGQFHEWNDKLVCSLCGTKYSDILAENNTNHSNQLKFSYLRKLASTYCITGEIHDIDITTNKCNKCKIDVVTHKYTERELLQLDSNIKKIKNNVAAEQLEKIKTFFKKQSEQIEHNVKVIQTYNERYKKYTHDKIINYIDDFIDIIVKNIGTKVKIREQNLYVKDTLYIISNDYLGNNIKNKIIILSSDNKILRTNEHVFYKRDVLYYHDKVNNVYVYYDAITKNYLGYSKDNRKFELYKSNIFIEIVYSVRDMLIYLGLEHEYFNISHLSNTKNVLEQIIRIRVNNLKQIIYRTNSIIEKINNSYPNKENAYNSNEYKLIAEFQKTLKNFNTSGADGYIFKHIFTITNNLNVHPITTEVSTNKNYIHTNILTRINNIDSILLFYYIYNLTKLIQYNEQPAIKTNISFMIVNIIQYCYNLYYIPIENSQIRKFDSLLFIDAPYIDESSRVIGLYQELVNVKEIDEEVNKEKEYDANEEQNALDIDEYDENDLYEDNDPSDEVVENLMGNE